MKKIITFLFIALLAFNVITCQSVAKGYQAEETVTNALSLDGPVYTHRSGGKTRYEGSGIAIIGLINDKELGPIGAIFPDGTLRLEIPATVPDELLASTPPRGQAEPAPQSNVKGGTLTTAPTVRLWKSDDDFLIFVYVSEDFGPYTKGWNFANNKHEKVQSIDGYRWTIIDGF